MLVLILVWTLNLALVQSNSDFKKRLTSFTGLYVSRLESGLRPRFICSIDWSLKLQRLNLALVQSSSDFKKRLTSFRGLYESRPVHAAAVKIIYIRGGVKR